MAASDSPAGDAPIADRQIDVYPGRSGYESAILYGDIATFTDADPAPYTEMIDWGDGVAYEVTEPEISWRGATGIINAWHEYERPGRYEVRLTLTDWYGLSDTHSLTVTVTVHDVHPICGPFWAVSTGEPIHLDALSSARDPNAALSP